MIIKRITASYAAFLISIPILSFASGVPEKRQVAVITGRDAPAIERFAARELCRYLDVLYGIQAEVGTPPVKSKYFSFLLGNPTTNPAITTRLPGGFPKVSDQGVVLQSLPDGSGLIVGGGSPQATLWAVYELVERWGVRYLLHGDVLPPRSQFQPPTLAIIHEPIFRIRQWRVVNELAVGPASWGIADYRPLIDQLAKLRFNRILAYIWPHQPFLNYSSGGVHRSSSSMFFGFHYPLTNDMPGRRLFGRGNEFHNPDLPEKADYTTYYIAARRHLTELMAYARSRGMSCVLGLTATEFPPEFGRLFRNPQKVHQVGEQTIVPGPDTALDDPALTHLSHAVLEAAINTYPDASAIDLGMQEWRQWVGEFQRAWDRLDNKYHLGGPQVMAQILERARHREHYDAGRAEAEVKGDVVSIYFYDRLLSGAGAFSRRPKFILDSVSEELFPYLDRMAPWASETLNSIDYTPARILARRSTLRQMGAARLLAALIYTLHDDNIGILPQLETGALHALNGELRRDGWAGFSTRYWLIGEQDPCVAYLVKAAWNAKATPENAYRDQLRAVCGEACVKPMLAAFDELEYATRDLELHALGVAFPVPGMAMKFWKNAPLPPEYNTAREHYEKAWKLVEAAIEVQSGHHPDYLAYYAGRLRFGILYFRMIDEIHLGAVEESAGNLAAARQAASRALKLARDAIESFVQVARDQSDKGTIAVLDTYVYRPLKEKAQSLALEQRP